MPEASSVPASLPTFESALEELETLVHSLEGDRLSLEESLSAYQRGVELMRFCQEALATAEKRIQILDDGGSLRDFPAEGGDR